MTRLLARSNFEFVSRYVLNFDHSTGLGSSREDYRRPSRDSRQAATRHQAWTGRSGEDHRVRSLRQHPAYLLTSRCLRILLELDPSDDPVWIFFDTQHRHILQLLRTSAEASMSRIRVAMDQYGEVFEDDRKAASDLRACVASLEALDGEQVRGMSI